MIGEVAQIVTIVSRYLSVTASLAALTVKVPLRFAVVPRGSKSCIVDERAVPPKMCSFDGRSDMARHIMHVRSSQDRPRFVKALGMLDDVIEGLLAAHGYVATERSSTLLNVQLLLTSTWSARKLRSDYQGHFIPPDAAMSYFRPHFYRRVTGATGARGHNNFGRTRIKRSGGAQARRANRWLAGVAGTTRWLHGQGSCIVARLFWSFVQVICTSNASNPRRRAHSGASVLQCIWSDVYFK
jgi:hypothetical protein